MTREHRRGARRWAQIGGQGERAWNSLCKKSSNPSQGNRDTCVVHRRRTGHVSFVARLSLQNSYFITTIANCVVSNKSARFEESYSKRFKYSALNGRLKGVLGVMAVLNGNMAWDAEVIIFTNCASNEVLVGKF